MLRYLVRLGWTSLRGTPVVTALLLAGITLGVGVATAALTVDYALSRDPLPGRSERLHYVRLDAWDPLREAPHTGGIPTQLTWRDASGIASSEIPLRQTATFQGQLFVANSKRPQERPSRQSIRLVESDFFAMFGVPFLVGSPWDRSADEKAEQVVVLGSELAMRLLGTTEVVGSMLRVGDRELAVVGVIDRWRPNFKVYDPTQNPFDSIDEVYIPLALTVPMEIQTTGNRDGWTSIDCDGFVECLQASETVFLQYWVELADADAARDYAAFLDAYATEQKRLGRFQRPLRTELTPLRALFLELGLRPPQVRAISTIAVLFMVVCAVNLVGLFLGKFLARASIVGVRRALGASRVQIFAQHLVEASLVGFAAAVAGLVLAAAMLAGLRRGIASLFGDPGLFRLDLTMVLAALGLAAVATLIASAYPAWRICSIPPAQHLKLQ